MSRHQESNTSPADAATFKFLDAYDNKIFSDDDGVLLGQLSMLNAGIFVEGHDDHEWHEAVSCEVSAR